MAAETSVMAVIRASRPSFRNPHDKVAFAAHASFLAAGYVLTATANRAYSENVLSSSGQEEVGIEGWNDLDECYGFVYMKTEKESKKSVLMKCLVIGDNLAIDVLSSGDGQHELIDLQINVNDYVSDEGSSSTSYAGMYKNFKGLVELLDSRILSRLESTPKGKLNTTTRSETTQRGEGFEQSEVQPAPSFPIEPAPYYPGSTLCPPNYPAGTGDLYPGPGAGVYPMRDINDGSMLVGPNDPRWFGGIGGGQQPEFPGRIPGVPPGARFDPYGPPGVPGFEPNRFIRNPRRPHGGTHPDVQHFPDADYI